LNDEDIISKYGNAFKDLTKRFMRYYIARHVCTSCERLCYKRNVFQINKFNP